MLDAFALRYAPQAVHAEDYDLWQRAAAVMRLANIPEILYHYRLHQDQVSDRFKAEQRRQSDLVRARALARLGIACSTEQLALHCAVATGTPFETFGESLSALRWIRSLRTRVGGTTDVERAFVQECRKVEADLRRRIRRRLLRPLRFGRGADRD